MNEMQKKILEILRWFHELCQKHNLRYYIIAGTMLGAARHGGFIPWDDDIDVGMPRSDYEKLRQLCQNQTVERYLIEYPGKGVPFLWAKAYDTTTTLIEKQRHPIKRGVYVDIFPLDGIGNSKDEAAHNFKAIQRMRNLDSIISLAMLKRRSLYKNCAILVGRMISPIFVNKQRLSRKIDETCQKYNFDDSKFVGSLLGGFSARALISKEIYGQPTLIKFEDLEVFGVEHPHEYLMAHYGDYMQLPPIEKRISHHDSFLMDLDRGYLDD